MIAINDYPIGYIQRGGGRPFENDAQTTNKMTTLISYDSPTQGRHQLAHFYQPIHHPAELISNHTMTRLVEAFISIRVEYQI